MWKPATLWSKPSERGEKVPQAIVEKFDMSFVFKAGDKFTMMDSSNYEQIELDEKQVGAPLRILERGFWKVFRY